MNIYPHSSSNTNQASPLWLDLNHLLNPGFFVHLDMACLHLIIFSPYKKGLDITDAAVGSILQKLQPLLLFMFECDIYIG
jgi:hypothetical protein